MCVLGTHRVSQKGNAKTHGAVWEQRSGELRAEGSVPGRQPAVPAPRGGSACPGLPAPASAEASPSVPVCGALWSHPMWSRCLHTARLSLLHPSPHLSLHLRSPPIPERSLFLSTSAYLSSILLSLYNLGFIYKRNHETFKLACLSYVTPHRGLKDHCGPKMPAFFYR